MCIRDSPNIREVLSILLSSEGYKIIEAENGDIALEIMNVEADIELAILDVMMPGISGVEVCAEIRKNSDIPILFLTAKSQDHDKVLAYTCLLYTSRCV